MRRATIAVAVLVAMLTTAVRAQDQGQAPDLEALLPKPSAEHELLKADVGTWDATITTYMGGPDAPPEISKGVETNRMLGELWVVSDFEGDFAGLPFAGHAQVGFDPTADRYVMCWVDSMSPRLMTLQGTYDAGSKTLTMTGKAYDPMLEKEVEQKTTSRSIDEDHRVFTMYMKAPEYGDDWIKGMEIQYSRRKANPPK
jgi:hypothetical protein